MSVWIRYNHNKENTMTRLKERNYIQLDEDFISIQCHIYTYGSSCIEPKKWNNRKPLDN